jgi:hypothetical protein
MDKKLNFIKVADILLLQDKSISIEQLSLLTDLPIDEVKSIIDFFAGEGFLKNGKSYSSIILNEKAK